MIPLYNSKKKEVEDQNDEELRDSSQGGVLSQKHKQKKRHVKQANLHQMI